MKKIASSGILADGDVGSGTSVSSLQPDDVRALMTRLWQICKIQTAQNEKTVFAGNEPHINHRSHYLTVTMWFQQLRGATKQRNAGGGNRTADQSPASAAISSADAVVSPPTTAQDSSTMRSVDLITNDQKSVPVDDNGNSENTNGRPDLSTIVEEADEDMCSDLTCGR